PVVHYMMGGISTDINAKTTLEGLYAAGETACVSLNGGNRLGSNSLTELLVFGTRAGRAAAAYATSASAPGAVKIQALAADEKRREVLILGPTSRNATMRISSGTVWLFAHRTDRESNTSQ